MRRRGDEYPGEPLHYYSTVNMSDQSRKGTHAVINIVRKGIWRSTRGRGRRA